MHEIWDIYIRARRAAEKQHLAAGYSEGGAATQGEMAGLRALFEASYESGFAQGSQGGSSL